MDEAALRAAVIAEARSWIKTPYHPCSDIKGAGVDCGLLLVRVFCDTGICPPFDPRPFPPQWHLHRSEERYLRFITDRAREVVAPRPGDVALFKYGLCYSHGGVVTIADPLTIVHAFWPARVVLEQPVSHDGQLASPERCVRFYDPFGATT